MHDSKVEDLLLKLVEDVAYIKGQVNSIVELDETVATLEHSLQELNKMQPVQNTRLDSIEKKLESCDRSIKKDKNFIITLLIGWVVSLLKYILF